MLAQRYDFYVSVVRTISHLFAALTHEKLILPLEHKIHIFSLPCNILYILVHSVSQHNILTVNMIQLMYIVNLLWTDGINRSVIKQIINIVVVNFKVRHKHCIAIVLIHLKTNQLHFFDKYINWRWVQKHMYMFRWGFVHILPVHCIACNSLTLRPCVLFLGPCIRASDILWNLLGNCDWFPGYVCWTLDVTGELACCWYNSPIK